MRPSREIDKWAGEDFPSLDVCVHPRLDLRCGLSHTILRAL